MPASLSTQPLTIHHFGPDPSTSGGMATVIRLCVQHRAGGDRVEAHPTWRPGSPLSPRAFASATRALMSIPAGEITHVHLSERGSFLREGALVALARRRDLTTVVTIHGAEFVPYARAHSRLVSSVLARAHLIVCLDPDVLELVRRLAPGTPAEIVPNPVVVPSNCTPADATDEVILFAGEISLRKGADVMVGAWRTVAERRPRARCLMVGRPVDCTPEASERLQICPPADPTEMERLMRDARAIALPARAEGMPMVLTEAMSLARPFVSTPVGAVPELAAAGGPDSVAAGNTTPIDDAGLESAAGLLVPVGDASALADRLTKLLADPNLACVLGENGRRFCARTRGVEVLDARMRELYTAAGNRPR
jgi:glycosyltransferase involved in cell wall biosynthesis